MIIFPTDRILNLNSPSRIAKENGVGLINRLKRFGQEADSVWYRGTHYGVTNVFTVGIQSMCGGTATRLTFQEADKEDAVREAPPYQKVPYGNFIEAGIHALLIEGLPRGAMLSFAKMMELIVKDASLENASMCWAYGEDVLTVLVQVEADIKDEGCEEEDAELSPESKYYDYLTRKDLSLPQFHAHEVEETSRDSGFATSTYLRPISDWDPIRSRSIDIYWTDMHGTLNSRFYDDLRRMTSPHWLRDIKGGCLISSNIGCPSAQGTIDTMALLCMYSGPLKVAGYHVMTPPRMGSNPNEGNHFIAAVNVRKGITDSGAMKSDHYCYPDIEDDEYDPW